MKSSELISVYSKTIQENYHLTDNEREIVSCVVNKYIDYIFDYRTGYTNDMIKHATNMTYETIARTAKDIYKLFVMIKILQEDIKYDNISCVSNRILKEESSSCSIEFVYNHGEEIVSLVYHNRSLDEHVTIFELDHEALNNKFNFLQDCYERNRYQSFLTDGFLWVRKYKTIDKSSYTDFVSYNDIKIEIQDNGESTLYYPDDVVCIDYGLKSDLLDLYFVLSALFNKEDEYDIAEFFDYVSMNFSNQEDKVMKNGEN